MRARASRPHDGRSKASRSTKFEVYRNCGRDARAPRLFVPQRNHWIDARRSSRGQVAGQPGDRDQ